MPSPIGMMIDRACMVCTICSKPAGTCGCWVKCECGINNLRGKECRNQIWHISKRFAEEAADLIIADMAESYKLFQREHIAARLKRAVIRQAQPIMTEIFDGVEAAIKDRQQTPGA